MPSPWVSAALNRRVYWTDGFAEGQRCRGRCHCLCDLGPTRRGNVDRGSGEKRPSTGFLIFRDEARPHRRSRGSAGSTSRGRKETVRQRPRWVLGVCPPLSKACRPVSCERMLSKRPIV